MNVNESNRRNSDASNRTLNDYVDLSDVFDRVIERPNNCNCHEQLSDITCTPCVIKGFDTPNRSEDEDDDNEPDAVERARRREEQRTTIEDHGEWKWSLTVEGDDIVRASKAIPYDGVVTFSTADRASHPRKRSQHRLDVEQIVGRFHEHSQTQRAKNELIARVRAARVGARANDE